MEKFALKQQFLWGGKVITQDGINKPSKPAFSRLLLGLHTEHTEHTDFSHSLLNLT